jgi:dCTP deaminase
MMSGFWSSETMLARLPTCIAPYDPAAVVNCSYELKLGSQIYVTSETSKTRRDLRPLEQVSIPPGQFAQLLTFECVTVPNDCLALISMKSGLKLRGLINVSGFHVDPGFTGHLLFSVYNAGPNDIVLSERSPAFLIWFSSLDAPTGDVYRGSRNGLAAISDDDVMKLQGDVYTPQALASRVASIEGLSLDRRINELEATASRRERRRGWNDMVVTAVVAGALMLALTLFVQAATAKDPPSVLPTTLPTTQPISPPSTGS